MKRRNLVLGAGLGFLGGPGLLYAQSVPQKPIRAILVFSGIYFRYQAIFYEFVQELQKQGILQDADIEIPSETYDVRPLWEAVARQNEKSRLLFLANETYSFGYDEKIAKEKTKEIHERILQAGDIDLIFVLGTFATRHIVEKIHEVPVISLECSAALSSGLLSSAEERLQKNIHIRVAKDLVYKQIVMLYKYRPFKKLGFACDISQVTAMNLPEIDRACQALGVGLTYEILDVGQRDKNEWYKEFFSSIRQLVEERNVDAVYLPFFPGTDQQFNKVVLYLAEHRIPSFAQTGEEPVERGVMMGMSHSLFKKLAVFEANVVKRFMDGESLEKIPQTFESSIPIALNLKTAMALGWNVDVSTLVDVDNVYISYNRGKKAEK